MFKFITHKSFPIFMFIILYPYYVLPSGMPQPSHIIFLAGAFFLILITQKFYINKLGKRVLFYFSLFIIYTLIVNLISVMIGDLLNPFLYSMYYIFGIIMILYAFENKDKKTFAKYLIVAVIISMTIELLLVFAGVGNWGGVRFAGTFNNPNQLGYYALLSGSIGILASFYLKKSLKFMMIILSLSFLLSLLSGSRTAVVAAFYLYVATLYYNKSYKVLIFNLIFLFVVGTMLIIVYGSEIEMISMFLDRLDAKTTAQHDVRADFVHRGLGRIPDYGLYIFTGMSEGIQYLGYDIEAHNSVLAMLYGYGIIGVVFISMLMFAIWKKEYQNFMIGIVPAMLYGMGHNGMRATLLYLIIALIVIFSKNNSGQYVK